MLAPVLVTAPASPPVTLSEVKAHCRVEGSDYDDQLTGFVEAATAHLDGRTGVLGRAIVTQTWRQDFNGFGGSVLRLPLAPVASITSVTYYDTDGAQQTLASSVYELCEDALGPYVALKVGQAWPSTYARRDAVSVTFVAGNDVADVPRPLKQAVQLLAGHYFMNREAVSPVNMVSVPATVDALIKPFRRVVTL